MGIGLHIFVLKDRGCLLIQPILFGTRATIFQSTQRCCCCHVYRDLVVKNALDFKGVGVDKKVLNDFSVI